MADVRSSSSRAAAWRVQSPSPCATRHHRPSLTLLDPVAAAAVSMVTLGLAMVPLRQASLVLLHTAPRELLQEVTKALREVPVYRRGRPGRARGACLGGCTLCCPLLHVGLVLLSRPRPLTASSSLQSSTFGLSATARYQRRRHSNLPPAGDARMHHLHRGSIHHMSTHPSHALHANTNPNTNPSHAHAPAHICKHVV